MMSSSLHTIMRRSPDGRREMCYAWFQAMHTRVDLALIGPAGSATPLAAAAADIEREVRAMEGEGSRFDPSSPLSALNAAPVGCWVELPTRLAALLAGCRRWRGLTLGLFDVTAGSEGHTPLMPLALELAPAAARRTDPRLSVDLSGVLKGCAADAAAAIVRRHGIADALISMGNSSVVALGSMRAGGGGWPVAASAGGGAVTLCGEALTTSGNDTPGRRHIINPLTGRMACGRRTVSVVTPTATMGEVMSTAMFLADGAQRDEISRRACVRIVE